MFLEILDHHYNAIGMVGVVLVLTAYFLLQIDKMSQDGIIFSVVNVIGSICILVSLHFTPNLASEIIEWAWLGISFFGIIKSVRIRYFRSANKD